jgi:PelA/Pel-15E family pectate lyase
MKIIRLNFFLFTLMAYLFAGCKKKEIEVPLEISKDNVLFNAAGGMDYIDVTSSAEWTVTGAPDWLSVSPSSGSGKQRIEISSTPNPSALKRTSSVEVSDGKTSKIISVNQEGTTASTDFLAQSTIVANASGQIAQITVKTGTVGLKYEIPAPAASWITMLGTDASSVSFNITFNNSGVNRTAQLKFSQGANSGIVQISQAPFQSTIASLKWLNLALTRPATWYSSNEAKEVAENVLIYQRSLGGWPKNIEMHWILTDRQKDSVRALKGNRDAIFDNGATTTEMQFMGKMYNAVKDERYRAAVSKSIDFIISAQYGSAYKGEGGWPQSYPLKGSGYADRITFNDNAITNLLRVLKLVYQKSEVFSQIVTDDVASKAKSCFDKGVKCILNCQVTENGVKTFWAAQHDEYTLDPATGRPHELPSYSGMEGADILKFLMEIDNPSQEIKDAVVAAVAWLEKSKIPNKRVVDVSSGGVVVDREIISSPGNDLWGRFMQIGGDVGTRVHLKMVNSYVTNSTYKQNATSSYDATKTWQPIFGIYDNTRPVYLYRYLYIYETAPFVNSVPVSLDANTRKSYQFVGNWPQTTIKTTFPAWKTKNGL